MKMSLGLKATAECPDVQAEIFVNEQLVSHTNASITEFITEITLPENPMNHTVEIRMSGKSRQHTQIDNQGNIVSDVAIIVETLEIEDIDMKPIFCQGLVCYNHRSNDLRKPLMQDEFYGYIGYNGSVEIKFATPIYLWLMQYFDH
jgi:hypothetical protein